MKKRVLSLHWKLFIPLIALMWLIIGITISYFINHEKHRQRENLENRLKNVNATVLEAYNNGVDLQETVGFIRLFTDNTTLDPLRITVYNHNGLVVADNSAETILLYDEDGNPYPELLNLINSDSTATVKDIVYRNDLLMISSRASDDGEILTLAALPYKGEVLTFLSIDPMVWLVVVLLGVISSILAYLGVRTVTKNVYTLRDFAQAIASDRLPDDIEDSNFSKDELGDVSRNLLTLYRNKIKAETEKIQHERLISQNISHELNTPIGIIKGYIDTVLNDSRMPEETRNKFLVRAKQNTDRLASLVSDLGTVMRLQRDASIELRPVDFKLLASRVADDTVQGHIAGKMSLHFDIPDGCTVIANEHLLNNALLNLIYNAAQHSEGTEMTINWLRKENGRHIFKFADNGIGVDKEHIGRLFDLFYRVDYGRTRKRGGAGLGLPLVLRIITAMGGTITADSPAGHGLEFTFALRAADPTD